MIDLAFENLLLLQQFFNLLQHAGFGGVEQLAEFVSWPWRIENVRASLRR